MNGGLGGLGGLGRLESLLLASGEMTGVQHSPTIEHLSINKNFARTLALDHDQLGMGERNCQRC